MTSFDTSHVKNIVLLGHAGSGKTTLAECMLFEAGLTTRRGTIEEKIDAIATQRKDAGPEANARAPLRRINGLSPDVMEKDAECRDTAHSIQFANMNEVTLCPNWMDHPVRQKLPSFAVGEADSTVL